MSYTVDVSVLLYASAGGPPFDDAAAANFLPAPELPHVAGH